MSQCYVTWSTLWATVMSGRTKRSRHHLDHWRSAKTRLSAGPKFRLKGKLASDGSKGHIKIKNKTKIPILVESYSSVVVLYQNKCMTETCALLTDASPFDRWEDGLVFRKVRESSLPVTVMSDSVNTSWRPHARFLLCGVWDNYAWARFRFWTVSVLICGGVVTHG